MRTQSTRLCLHAVALASSTWMTTAAHAIEFDTGDEDWTARWDNTVKGSLMVRTKTADPVLVDSFRQPGPAAQFPQALNFNAGDDNFRKSGVVSRRMDLLSEFDATFRRDWGIRVSAAGWYDDVYFRRSDAHDPMNGQTPFNEFPEATRDLAGRKLEMLDAFASGSWDLGGDRKLTARLGRHAFQYGESLFFGDNGIARAQAPIDIFKLLSSPNAQFKEIIRPVPQISAQMQVSPTLSFGGYYQFRWEQDRLPPSGSYFSSANTGWGSQQPQFLGIQSVGDFVLQPSGDRKAKNFGQFGFQVKWRLEDTDLGFYAARYHDKSGQIYSKLNPIGAPSPFGTLPGSWSYVFPENVRTYGVSASQTHGDANFAVEASIRDNVPLRSANIIYGFYPGQAQPEYATGRTAHVNLSTLASFDPNFFARESSLVAEIAWNRLLHKRDPDAELDQGRTRDATAIQMTYTPVYRQVLPGLDLNVPIGLRYIADGRSSVTAWDARGSGSFNIGFDGTYLGIWQFSVVYTRSLGKADPFLNYTPSLTGGSPVYSLGNPLADRDQIAIGLRRTF